MTDISSIIDGVVRQFGSEAKAAKAAGVSQPLIHTARRSGRCGPKLAIGIERATDGAVSRSDLRPDLWPPEYSSAGVRPRQRARAPQSPKSSSSSSSSPAVRRRKQQ